MKSVPPRGSGWVVLERQALIPKEPTRYREVVLTSLLFLMRLDHELPEVQSARSTY